VTTIGVAIAIPEPWATRLQAYRTAIGDTTAALIPTHITLLPPLAVGDDLEQIDEHLNAAAVGITPFRIHLRGTGTFRPISPVVFVTLAEGIWGCEQLAARIRRGPLAADLEFPYHPHVTVAHHLPDAVLDRAFDELADFDCAFEVEAFHRYHHDDVTGWQPTCEFRLEGGGRG
jgi:2'-5' RNA ligase